MYQTLKNSAANAVQTSMNTDLAPAPHAIRATFFWIMLFYVSTILTTGLCISWGDPTLLTSIYMIVLPKFLEAVVVLTLSLIRFQRYGISDHCSHINAQANRNAGTSSSGSPSHICKAEMKETGRVVWMGGGGPIHGTMATVGSHTALHSK
ncbi:hypothetical protein BKA83DRAFT_4127545 [Pisolithus microcarpus]|nr:hypothetical protein BKA83DRAFT_4127545 [Pisolithus microcarpus]